MKSGGVILLLAGFLLLFFAFSAKGKQVWAALWPKV